MGTFTDESGHDVTDRVAAVRTQDGEWEPCFMPDAPHLDPGDPILTPDDRQMWVHTIEFVPDPPEGWPRWWVTLVDSSFKCYIRRFN